MLRGSLRGISVAVWVVTQAAAQSGSGPTVLGIDSANSQILIEVGKTGMFGFAGHAHEVAAADVHGRVTFDPTDLQHASVSLEFAAAALRVTGKDEPPADVAEVQKVMLSERVLDVLRFPTIAFSSRRLSVRARTAGTASVEIEGDMTLHATTRPMTIAASLTLDAGGRITARGSFVLKQTDFGMVPVTAAGGAIRVKDELDIQFVLRTRPSDDTRRSLLHGCGLPGERADLRRDRSHPRSLARGGGVGQRRRGFGEPAQNDGLFNLRTSLTCRLR